MNGDIVFISIKGLVFLCVNSIYNKSPRLLEEAKQMVKHEIENEINPYNQKTIIMYKITDFLERYKEIEKFTAIRFGYDGSDKDKPLETYLQNSKMRYEVSYFRKVRNVLTHYPLEDVPRIELTDRFKERFEALCNRLMNNISQMSIPYKNIYKRELSDKVFPTIATMREKVYSYVPIMNGKKVWGVFSESTIFNIVGNKDVSFLQDDIQFFNIGKYITNYSETGFYDFAKDDDSIDDIYNSFADAFNSGRKLDVIYITSTGDKDGDLLSMVTIWDISNL